MKIRLFDPHMSGSDIADELGDIWYCLVRVADHYGVDLEEAIIAARRKEMRYLGREATF